MTNGWRAPEAYTDLETARLVTSAEMWSEQRDNDAALGAIDRLQAAGARHIHAMRIALNANLQSGPLGRGAEGTARTREAQGSAPGARAAAEARGIP